MPNFETQLKHLKKDKLLKKVIERVGPIKTKKETDLYFSLMQAIVSQQLSVKAAATIWNRFLTLFKNAYPDPKSVLKLSDQKLRSVGLSFQKAGYLKNIAAFSLEKTLDHGKLKKLSDEDLINYLVEIKGVGRWTVEMLLMFSLKRHDVFPKDDLGIQNGIVSLYGIEATNKKELFLQMELISQKWRPYRSLACMYIWRHKDNKPL